MSGPQGPRGTDGAPGPTGPAGPAGPRGLPGSIDAHYAVQSTAVAATPVDGWIEITGAEQSLAITEARTVDLEASGTAVAEFGTVSTALCAFRFVVDGEPLSASPYGDRVILCDRADPGRPSTWCGWSMRQQASLTAGTHDVKLEVRTWPSDDATCTLPSDAAFTTKLYVVAR